MYSFSKYKAQYRANLKLALPVVAAQLGHILVQFADNIMVGHYGGDDPLPLAAVAFGSMASFLFFITGLGITLGLTPLVGELYARGDEEHASSYLKHAIVLYSLLGLAITLLQRLAVPLLYRLGQPIEVADMAVPYYKLLAISAFPVMLFGAFKQFLEGVGNTTAAMSIIIGCNVLNVFLNRIFIYGGFGCPEMGAAGAGMATLVSRAVMPVAALWYFLRRASFRRYIERMSSVKLRFAEMRSLLTMGFPIAAQMFLEASAFVITSMMTGWFGTIAISSNQAAMTVGNCIFMIVTAIGAAATIRISHCYGARNIDEMSLAAKASLHIVLVWNTLAILLLVAFNGLIPKMFTTNAEVIALTSVMLIYVAMYQLFDGLQCVAIGIMRGIQDVKVIPLISFLSYIVLNIPIGYLCSFTLGLGPEGLYLGYLFGLGASAVLLLLRVRRKIREMRR